jgi:puromycin-sensitive aminopeptidase
MDSWIFQGGHPEVSVDRGDGGTTVRLAQVRSRYAGVDGAHDGDADDTLWAVPVLARWVTGPDAGVDGATSSQQLERVLLDGPTAEIELGAPADWVLVNSGGSGFFRVRYDQAGRDALAGAATELTPLERYGLVDDAWASLLGGSLEVGELLRLLRAAADETDLSVWQRIAGVIGGLDRIVADADRPALQGWVRALVGPALLRLGPDPVAGESSRDAARRATLFATLGILGADPDAAARARSILDQSDAGGDVDADLLDAAVRVLAATGDAATFADFRRRAAEGTTPQERLRFLGALADFPGEAEIGALLEATLTDEVRSQDAPFVLRRSLTNRERAPQAWAFVAQRFADLSNRLPSNTVARMLEGVRTFGDASLAREVEGFVAEHPVPQAARLVTQHIERMWTSVALVDRTRADLGAALTTGPV